MLKRFLIALLFHVFCTSSIWGQAPTCDEAPLFCGLSALNGYSSTMPQFNPIDEPAPFCAESSGGSGNPQNMLWFAFTANSIDASLEFTFSNCQSGTGYIQYGVYTDCDFSEYLVGACQGTAENPALGPIEIDIEGMIIGEDYFLFIDGDNGTYCDYSIEVTSSSGGEGLPSPTSLDCISTDCPADGVICDLGTTLTFQPAGVDIPADYIWTVSPGPPTGPDGTTTNPENTASFTFDNPGEYEICVVISDGCAQTDPVCYQLSVFPDEDNDGTCDPEDLCADGPEPGMPCDDADHCTINDTVTESCGCSGTFQDTDNDGTCDADDLCPNSPEPGMACDDADPCTINDLVDMDCNCLGIYSDIDGDGTCDAEDLCPDGPEPGTPCDDNDNCTTNDAIDMNCNCLGTFQDADDDGTCDADDLCPDSPEPGSPCDDGDVNTVDDLINPNCDCEGTINPDYCPELMLSIGDSCDDGDDCTIDDIVDADCNCVGIFQDADDDGTCDADDLCPDGPEPGTACDDDDPCTESDQITADCQCLGIFQDADNDGTCDAEDLCPDSPEPGTACNDNDHCTNDDVINNDCECEGTFIDSDADGTCDANDQCPEGPEPGTTCDDGNINTFNDQIDENCNCIGTGDPNYCPGLDLNIGDPCDDNDRCTIDDIVTTECLCIGTYQDADNDGTCDADDICPESPEPGTACDDGDSATENDVITEDCICIGEETNAVDDTALNFKVYPNPIKNKLTIEVLGKQQIQLYTIQGQLVLETQMKHQITLDLGQLQSGIYILSITNDSSRGTQKVMKL